MGMKWPRLQVNPHVDLVRLQFDSEHLHYVVTPVAARQKFGKLMEELKLDVLCYKCGVMYQVPVGTKNPTTKCPECSD